MANKLKIFITVIFFTTALFFALSNTSYALNISVGTRDEFNVDQNYHVGANTKIYASAKKISEHAYFYVEDSYWNSLIPQEREKFNNELDSAAQEFDNRIYPILTSKLGPVWNPGIDGDSKITILFLELEDWAGGYFNSLDGYPKTKAPDSNEREIIYINAVHITSSLINTFVAHEFQHLISFYNKDIKHNKIEETWLNELRSEAASIFLGYNNDFKNSRLKGHLQKFLANPNDNLTSWMNESIDYAAVNIFANYLYDQYKERLFSTMLSNDKVGIESVNEALGLIGAKEDFSRAYMNWTVANLVNDVSLGERFGYKNANLNYDNFHIEPTSVFNVSYLGEFNISYSVNDWSSLYYEFGAARGDLKFEIKGMGASSNFKVPYIIKLEDGTKKIKFINLEDTERELLVYNFGERASSITFIPANHFYKEIEPSLPQSSQIKISFLSLEISKEEENANIDNGGDLFFYLLPYFPEGSLLRAKGDFKVYTTKGKYIRHILKPEIFDFYGHLGFNKIIEVDPLIIEEYAKSYLVRADGDYKVYEINDDLTRHWLNVSAESFVLSGRKWGMVYVINVQERDYYQSGEDIIY